ncbi:50S ribosomal protein L21 [Helicobacter bizzozeronii]|uniref:Large ribosomal subunit protein bL21 n=1 Tax=Helicobacter bizzozeronii (strain CIII-1) TaxID=1002804 RepID=F8KSC9_HELBC|nr:50S ribosomal protein L21 [Helicobacter bizzozeronii]CCB79698.1 LSU ribosomal protein L21p [Helicobacter bizzozeronii CIII-1]CCF79738.1 LSU ribosomal protein L21p [Helicobacter bizzozeronii CCUG 35545]
MVYAVFKNGGKQYKVQVGDVVLLDKMNLESKAHVELDQVLAVCKEGGVVYGAPLVSGAKVEAEVINEGRGKKVVIFKKRRRKDSKTKRGFRRDFTRVKITNIVA